MRMLKSLTLLAALSVAPAALAQSTAANTGTPAITVGPQYDTTHVYVAPQDFNRLVASLIATFGGATSKEGVF